MSCEHTSAWKCGGTSGSFVLDSFGSAKASRGGSASRHERDGVGTTPGMAQRDGMDGGGDGEHRFLLETGIQRFGRNCEDHLGESDARQGVERQENRFQG